MNNRYMYLVKQEASDSATPAGKCDADEYGEIYSNAN